MAQQATRITYPEDPGALCLGQPVLSAVAVSGHLAQRHDQYADPCAVPRGSVRDKLERFIENDFHHLAVDVANMKGQLKILLMLVGLIAAATIGEFVAIAIKGVIR